MLQASIVDPVSIDLASRTEDLVSITITNRDLTDHITGATVPALS
jgi:hypothetical protein